MTAAQSITGYAVMRRKTTAALITETRSAGHEEDRLQMAVLDLLDAAHLPGVDWWHVPNGGKRVKREAARLKRLGVKAGVSDLHISMPGGRFGFMELKAAKGRVSDEQKAFLAAQGRNGHLTAICRSLDEAAAMLAQWGAIKPVVMT